MGRIQRLCSTSISSEGSRFRRYDLFKAVKDIERIAKHSYIVVESYRNEEEKMNMIYWQLTYECFFKVEEWEWIYRQCGYTGDYSFIFFD